MNIESTGLQRFGSPFAQFVKDQDVPSVHSQVPGAGDWFPGVLFAPIHVLADGCGGIPVVTMSGVAEAKCPAFKDYQISNRIKISISE